LPYDYLIAFDATGANAFALSVLNNGVYQYFINAIAGLNPSNDTKTIIADYLTKLEASGAARVRTEMAIKTQFYRNVVFDAILAKGFWSDFKRL
jgi:hypothetical protein